jgi:ArsR family transcriptional regulator, cadmium/lead-responsive transcriptional repressor
MSTAAPPTQPNTGRFELTAKLFRGFADASRLAILEALVDRERCVSELVELTGLSQSNASGHLACLKECGLVEARQDGRFVYYRLADPKVAVMLVGADAILGRLADRIAACVNYGRDGRSPGTETDA